MIMAPAKPRNYRGRLNVDGTQPKCKRSTNARTKTTTETTPGDLRSVVRDSLQFKGLPAENPLFLYLTTENKTNSKGWLKLRVLELHVPDADDNSPKGPLSKVQQIMLLTQLAILPKSPGLLAFAWDIDHRRLKKVHLSVFDELLDDAMLASTPLSLQSGETKEQLPPHLYSPEPSFPPRKRADHKPTPALIEISDSDPTTSSDDSTPSTLGSPQLPTYAGGNNQRRLFELRGESPSLPSVRNAKAASCQTTTLSNQYQDEISTGNPSFDLQDLVCKAIDALVQKQDAKHTVELAGKHRRIYFRMPYLRASKADATAMSVRAAVKKKSKTIIAFVESCCSVQDTHQLFKVLSHVMANFKFSLIKADAALSVEELTALRDRIPTTTRGAERLVTALQDLRPTIFKTIFPSNVRKEISGYEAFSIPVSLGVEMATLEMGGEKKEMKPCLFAWVRNPQRVIEGLVRCALITDTFESSEDFSNHKDKVMIVQGSDKGGDTTLNLVRLLNRQQGNTPEYCFILAFYEAAKEGYNNLKKTLFSKTKPTQRFLQNMLYGKYYVITVTTESEDKVCDAQCVMIEIGAGTTNKQERDISKEQLTVNVILQAQLVDSTTSEDATECDVLPNFVDVPGSGRHRTLGASLVVLKESRSTMKQATGIRLFASPQCEEEELLHEASFAQVLEFSSTEAVRIKCYGIYCFTADDLKLNICVSGQGTAASLCPCPVCIAKKTELAASLDAEKVGNYHRLRTGEYSNTRLYQTFVEKAGDRATSLASTSTPASLKMKKEVKSVVYEPLLLTPPRFNTVALMHSPQGAMTHLTKKILNLLKSIDRDAAWYKNLNEKVLSDAEESIDAVTKNLKEINKEDSRLERDVESAKSMLPAVVAATQEHRQRHASAAGVAAWHDVKSSTTDLLEAGKKFVADSGLKPVGVASCVFIQSICHDGTVQFRKENSGIELTYQDGLRVLSRHDRIAARVCQAYRNDPSLQARVKDVMANDWAPLAKLLFDISKRLKSQRRISQQDAATLREDIIAFATLWRAKFGGNIYPKLHMLLDHVTTFAHEHGLAGRASEEGFEATHPAFQTISSNLSKMVSAKARAMKTMERCGLGLKDDYRVVLDKMKNGRKTGLKKCQYTKIGRASKRGDSSVQVTSVRGSRRGELPEGLVVCTLKDVVVKEDWLEYYEYLCAGKVPSAWSQPFRESEDLGDVCKAKSEFIYNN